MRWSDVKGKVMGPGIGMGDVAVRYGMSGDMVGERRELGLARTRLESEAWLIGLWEKGQGWYSQVHVMLLDWDCTACSCCALRRPEWVQFGDS